MDSTSEDLYFQKIQELVQDDDKIVTVSSLASDLGVSVQNSRKLISKYVEDQRKLNPDELAVTYVISGTLKDNGKRGVFMAREDDLKEKRKLFEPKPMEVIYSIQKNKNVDFNIIALVDMFDTTKIRETALQGSIVSKNCIKRVLKIKKLPSPPPPTIRGKSSFFLPKAEASTSSAEKSTEPPKAEQKAKPSGGIAELFKAAASKPKNGKNSTSKPNKPAVKRGLAAFLSNGALQSQKSTSKIENERKINDVKTSCTSENKINDEKANHISDNSESQNSVKEEEILEIMDVDFEDSEKTIEENKATKVESTNKDTEKINNSQKKKKLSKRKRDKSKEVPSKRRKRIIERNSSDSDDLFVNEDDNDDIIERSDEESERIPSPVIQKPVTNKTRQRKAVTKNYEDEEGFVVTTTEYVFESASEEENVEPEPPKQITKEKEPVVKSKPVGKKKPTKNQATLMNFFKKV